MAHHHSMCNSQIIVFRMLCSHYFYMCTLAGFLPLRHGWESEMWWQSWPWRRTLRRLCHGATRRCGGSGCTAAVRRCGGSVTAAMRRQPAHIPCHKCANPKRQRGRSKESTYRREGMMQRKRLLSLAKQFHLKKKSLSQLYCSMLYVVRLCIHPTAQCRIFLKRGFSLQLIAKIMRGGLRELVFCKRW